MNKLILIALMGVMAVVAEDVFPADDVRQIQGGRKRGSDSSAESEESGEHDGVVLSRDDFGDVFGDFPDNLANIADHEIAEFKTNLNLKSSRPCCSPDFIFVIDINDDNGFSRENCETHIREFIIAVIKTAHKNKCDQVRTAVVEYGTTGRIRTNFTAFTTVEAQIQYFRKYTPGSSLGKQSNALAGFTGAKKLLLEPARGRRPTSNAFVFWLTQSNPTQSANLQAYVNTFVKPESYVIVVAVGDEVDFSKVKKFATASDFAFHVDNIIDLVSKCSDFYFDYCPKPRTTTARTTQRTTTAFNPPATTTTRRTTTTTRAATTTRPATRTTTTLFNPPATTTTRRTTTKTTTTTTCPTTTEQEETTTIPNPPATTTTRRTTTKTTTRPTTRTTTTIFNPPATTTTTQKPTTTTKHHYTKKTTTKAATTTTIFNPPATTTTTKKPTTTKAHHTKKTTTHRDATTTRATTRLPDVTTPLPPSDFCFQCRMRRNHKDLYADSTDCHYYYQCFYYNETYAVGIRRKCAEGLFWHDEILQCMPEGDVPCVDRCRTSGLVCYGGVGCRQFFACANTASYGMCCPTGTRFNETSCGCDDDATCTSACSQQGPSVGTTVAPAQQINSTVCRDSFGTAISIVNGEDNAYQLLDEEGQVTEKQYCPEGVAFDLVTCRCDIENGATLPPAEIKRRAILWIPFDVDAKDYSYMKFTTFVYDGAQVVTNVNAQGGGSLFVNEGHVEIPGLKTYDLRNQASWCAFFRCESGNGFSCTIQGGVLSNNKDATSQEFTIILSNGASNTVNGRVHFWNPVGPQTVNSAISGTPASGWNHVCVTYNGNALRLYVNGANTDTEFVGGYLSIAHCPYVIGHDQQIGYFTGHIDDVLVTPFEMTQEEMTAHREGNRGYLRTRGFFP